MIFKYITLKNFKSYPDEEQRLDLNHNGIKLVTGKNGFGKTTIFEAIIWALYGKTLQDSVDGVINRYTKKNCKVGVCVEINGVDYTIYRYRSHETHGNNLYIFKGDKDISMKNMSDTQQLILDTVQMPYNAMINSTIFNSELYTHFMRSRSSDRLKILESILSLKEISVLYDITKKQMKGLEENKNKVFGDMQKASVGIETISTTIAEYKEKAKEKLISLKEEKKENQATIDANKKRLKELESIDVEAELIKIKVVKDNADINNKIAVEKEKYQDVDAISKTLESFQGQLDYLLSIDVNSQREILRQIAENNNKIAQIDMNIASERGMLIIYNKDGIDKLIKERDKYESDLASMKKSICPLCGHELEEQEREGLSREYTTKLLDVSIEIQRLEKVNEDNKKTNDLHHENIENLIKEKNAIPRLKCDYTEAKLNEITEKISSCKAQIAMLYERGRNAASLNDTLDKNIEELKKSLINGVSSDYTEEKLNKINDDKKSINDLISSLETRNEVIDGVAKTVYDKKFVESNEEKLRRLNEILNERSERYEEIETEYRHYNVLVSLFSNKEAGFKKYFIGKMIASFNESINFYIPFLFTDKEIKVEFDKDLESKITLDKQDVSFSSFSSGQKTRLEIACSFALYQLSKTFFSAESNLLVMDEILDMNLDEDGFNSVIEIIEGMSETNSIFIISHQNEYKEKFKDKIEIKLIDERFSRIVA